MNEFENMPKQESNNFDLIENVSFDLERVIEKKVIVYGYNKYAKLLIQQISISESTYNYSVYDDISEDIYIDDILVKKVKANKFKDIITDECVVIVTSYDLYEKVCGPSNVYYFMEFLLKKLIYDSFSNDKICELNLYKLPQVFEVKLTNIDKICIVGTNYGLLLYMLYIKDYRNTLFFIHGFYPLASAISFLRKNGCVCMFLSFDENIENEARIYNMILGVLSLVRKDINYYIQDTVPQISYFEDLAVNLIEDGRISYISEEDAKKTKGFDVHIYKKCVKKIIYTGMEMIPISVADKVEIIDFRDCWDKLEEMKYSLLEMFELKKSELKQIIDDGRDIVLFTRNYSKVGKCSEKTQVDMYREILSHYNDRNVIIKPHPNDDVDYKKYFPNCVILSKKIPAELIWLCRMPIKVVVSVDDSSNLFWVFKDSLRIDLYRELIKKYNIIRLRDQ